MKTTHCLPLSLLFAACFSLFLLTGCGSKSEAQNASQAGGAKPADTKPADGKAADAKPGDAKPAGGAPPGGAPKPPLPVKAVPVKVGLVENDITAVGTMLPAESVVIRSEIPGRVVGLHFQEGQAVGKGARLVSLDASEYRARLAGSTADARKEQQRYERSKELLAQKFVTQDAVDVAKAAMDVAKAKQQQDEVALSKMTIHAPFSGVVGLRLISPGAYVKAGDDIVRMENLSFLKLDFRIPEIYVAKVKPGLAVTVKTDAFPNDTFQGKIYAVEPTVDEKTRTVLARAQVPNSQTKLKPGMYGRVSILLESRPKALLVPEQAIWPQGRDSFVYRVVDGKAVLTKIEIGVRRPGEVEIAKGISDKDVIITDGQMKLRDGAPVAVLPAPPAAAAAQPGATPAAAGGVAPAATGEVKKGG